MPIDGAATLTTNRSNSAMKVATSRMGSARQRPGKLGASSLEMLGATVCTVLTGAS